MAAATGGLSRSHAGNGSSGGSSLGSVAAGEAAAATAAAAGMGLRGGISGFERTYDEELSLPVGLVRRTSCGESSSLFLCFSACHAQVFLGLSARLALRGPGVQTQTPLPLQVPGPAALAAEDPPLPWLLGDPRLLDPAIIVGGMDKLLDGEWTSQSAVRGGWDLGVGRTWEGYRSKADPGLKGVVKGPPWAGEGGALPSCSQCLATAHFAREQMYAPSHCTHRRPP